MTITVSEAGKRGAQMRNRNLSADRKREIAAKASKAAAKKRTRQAEINKANALAALRLNERAEGVK